MNASHYGLGSMLCVLAGAVGCSAVWLALIPNGEELPLPLPLVRLIEVDADDDGASVVLLPRQRLRVKLSCMGPLPPEGDRSHWHLVDLDQSLLKLSDWALVDEYQMIGYGGTEVWEFTPRSPGRTTMRLEHRVGDDVAGLFQLQVMVLEPGG